MSSIEEIRKLQKEKWERAQRARNNNNSNQYSSNDSSNNNNFRTPEKEKKPKKTKKDVIIIDDSPESQKISTPIRLDQERKDMELARKLSSQYSAQYEKEMEKRQRNRELARKDEEMAKALQRKYAKEKLQMNDHELARKLQQEESMRNNNMPFRYQQNGFNNNNNRMDIDGYDSESDDDSNDGEIEHHPIRVENLLNDPPRRRNVSNRGNNNNRTGYYTRTTTRSGPNGIVTTTTTSSNNNLFNVMRPNRNRTSTNRGRNGGRNTNSNTNRVSFSRLMNDTNVNNRSRLNNDPFNHPFFMNNSNRHRVTNNYFNDDFMNNMDFFNSRGSRFGDLFIPRMMGGRNINNMSYEQLSSMFPGKPWIGANKTTIGNNTMEFKVKDLDKEIPKDQKSCSICLTDFEKGDTIRRLPCLHVFHKKCVDEWLKRNQTCCVCRKDITETLEQTQKKEKEKNDKEKREKERRERNNNNNRRNNGNSNRRNFNSYSNQYIL